MVQTRGSNPRSRNSGHAFVARPYKVNLHWDDPPLIAALRTRFDPGATPGVETAFYEIQTWLHEGRTVTVVEAAERVQQHIERSAQPDALQREAGLRDTFNGGHEPVVYYMRRDRLIKIGTSAHLDQRHAQLGRPQLLATEPGDRDLEARRHKQFAAHRTFGEWFHVAAPLMDHITALREADPTSHVLPRDPKAAVVSSGRHLREFWVP